jgi:DNA modification methylase
MQLLLGDCLEKLNRNFIGIEKDAEYFTIATKRINNI